MISLRIRHTTSYRYRQPVGLGPHRLLLRPRESRELRLLSMDLTLTPTAEVTWAHDVFGNAVATANFRDLTDSLVIDCVAALQLDTEAWPVFNIAATAIHYPFRYTDDDWADLGRLSAQHYEDPAGRLGDWVRGFVRSYPDRHVGLAKGPLYGSGAANRLRKPR